MRELPKALTPLSDFNQFVLYKLIPKPTGKTDKIPIHPITLKAVNHLHPDSWVDFQTASVKASLLGEMYGVAFVFTELDPFWFLDIDNCLIDGNWSPLAQDLINRLAGCAIEVSQSGTGLHLFGTGDIKPHGCKDKQLGLELYHADRFVALTGIHASGDAYSDQTQAINAIIDSIPGFSKVVEEGSVNWTTGPREDWDGYTDDKELISKALSTSTTASAFGMKASFRELWEGNPNILAEFYPDDDPTKDYDYSAADMALANHLAFWTGCDCERMLRLMWQSGLVRDKWEQHKKLLNITIESAIVKQETVYNKSNFNKSDDANTPATIIEPVDDEVEVMIERARAEGAEATKAMALMNEIAASGWPIVQREVVAAVLYDTMKMANIDVKKTTVLNACTKGSKEVVREDNRIVFSDLKHNGKPKATRENLEALLHYYGITVKYNLMSKEVQINIPGKSYTIDNAINCSESEVASLCARHELPKTEVREYLPVIADENRYNPALNWILSAEWDGVDRLPELVKSLDSNNYNLTYWLVRRWLISGVAACFQPNGVNAAGMLVLQGDQYIGKSRWFWSLLDGNREWGMESAILNPHDKDSVKQCVSRWIVELGELDATFRRSDIAALKGFITRGEDELRLPYARGVSKYPRRTIYFGTVNPGQYLYDDTGNRRFWSVACGHNMNADHGLDVQQIWAQMKTYYDDGEQWWLTHQENNALNEFNMDFQASNPIEEKLLHFYNPTDERPRRLTATEILEEMGYDKPGVAQTRQLSSALRKLYNLESKKSGNRRVYDMPHPTTIANKVFGQ